MIINDINNLIEEAGMIPYTNIKFNPNQAILGSKTLGNAWGAVKNNIPIGKVGLGALTVGSLSPVDIPYVPSWGGTLKTGTNALKTAADIKFYGGQAINLGSLLAKQIL